MSGIINGAKRAAQRHVFEADCAGRKTQLNILDLWTVPLVLLENPIPYHILLQVWPQGSVGGAGGIWFPGRKGVSWAPIGAASVTFQMLIRRSGVVGG